MKPEELPGFISTALQPASERQTLSRLELQESEGYFRQLLELHSDVMLLIDHQSGVIVDANPSAGEFYGYPLETLRGMSVSQINAQHESEIHPQRQKAINGEKSIFSFEHRLANGDVRSVEAHISTVNYKGQSLFFSIIHDITERKRIETELRLTTAAFESQESMVITDADSVILKVNHAFTETTGYSSEEVVGRTPRLLKSGRHDADFYREMWQSLIRTGKWQGEIWDRRKDGEVYPKWLTITAVKDAAGRTTHYVALHLDITERKLAEEKITNMAYHDYLTNLPNRALFYDRLEQAMAHVQRYKNRMALLILDLDRFKPINDELGHTWGDTALVEISRRLQHSVRETDTVARLGGDEFSIILAEVDSEKGVSMVAEKVIAAIGEPLLLNGVCYKIGVSIGICLLSEADSDMENCISRADSAMYQAKASGRNNYRISA